ncbi:MAG: type II toxin-antitoxin system RelE/ParE family toxin [Sumerlaeia bacterium]
MPQTPVFLYRDEDGTVPLLDWLLSLKPKAQIKCLNQIASLAHFGHELRRPAADILRDRIYELRVKHESVNLRMLYFFDGREAVLVSHGLTKEKQIPPKEIDRAIQNRENYLEDREGRRVGRSFLETLGADFAKEQADETE